MGQNRWRGLTGHDLLAQAWWRPLPGIVVGAVVVGVLVSPLVGAMVGLAAWAVTMAYNVLLVAEGPTGPFRRRPWR